MYSKTKGGLIVVGIVACIIAAALFSGNRQQIDLTYKYDRAIIALPDGTVIEGKVTSWRDYEDGDQIQVKVNGKTYLVHSSNVALIAE